MTTTALPFRAAGHQAPPAASNPVLQALVAALLAMDAWFAARRRRADDLQALAQMSDYELRDLGLHRLDTLQQSWPFQSWHPELR